jgi:hypothetical protein
VTSVGALSYNANIMQLLILTVHKTGYPGGQFGLPNNSSKGNTVKILQNT